MRRQPFWLEIGTYRIKLPGSAIVTAEMHVPSDEMIGDAFTNWTVTLGRFVLFIHLSGRSLNGLKEFIDTETRADVKVQAILINDVPGVTHGSYAEPRTWIDWWFKKGGLTIALCLQSKVFPYTRPTEEEMDEHAAIIGSLTFLGSEQ